VITLNEKVKTLQTEFDKHGYLTGDGQATSHWRWTKHTHTHTHTHTQN